MLVTPYILLMVLFGFFKRSNLSELRHDTSQRLRMLESQLKKQDAQKDRLRLEAKEALAMADERRWKKKSMEYGAIMSHIRPLEALADMAYRMIVVMNTAETTKEMYAIAIGLTGTLKKFGLKPGKIETAMRDLVKRIDQVAVSAETMGDTLQSLTSGEESDFASGLRDELLAEITAESGDKGSLAGRIDAAKAGE